MSHKVFIGSTSRDLADYRQAAIDTCLRLNLHPIAMEYFTAMPMGATEGSKKKVEDSDWYVGIFAHRYGYIEDGYDKSVTEIEFDYAGERALPRLCFVIDPTYTTWPDEFYEKDHPAKLAAFKARIDKTLIRAQFTDVNDFALKLSQALSELKGEYFRPASTSAVLATDADAIPGKTAKFRGRTTFITGIQTALDKGERVLIQGFGGMGKTALAAECAAGYVPVLWVKAGTDSVDAVFEALARPFNLHKEIASETGEAQITLMRQILSQSNANLLLIDDAWDNKVLADVLKAVPTKMKVLVTSRHRYGNYRIVSVKELEPNEAVEILGTYAYEDFNNDADAASLCDLVGYHALALKIAGCTINRAGLTLKEYTLKIRDSLSERLTAQKGEVEQEHERITDVIKISLNLLDSASRLVFLAFGAFFVESATPELLSIYLGTQETSTALTNLVERGLAEEIPATDERVLAYQVHDLAYSYTKARMTLEQQLKAMEACLAYTYRYNEPSLAHFAALRPELENFMGASELAMEQKLWKVVEEFTLNLYNPSRKGGFLSYRGFYTQAIKLLERAARAAEKLGNTHDQLAHLGNMASTYQDVGRSQDAVPVLEQLLSFARNARNKKNEFVILALLGDAHNNLSEYSKAIEYYEQALQISRVIGDNEGEGVVLGKLGTPYAGLGEYGKAIEYYERALQISRVVGDNEGEGLVLGKLGDAYNMLSEYSKAIEYHEAALYIARETGNKSMQWNILGNLGVAYKNLGEFSKAIDYYEKVLVIAFEINDKSMQGNVLGSLGVVYMDLGEYSKAIEYYEQALVIRRMIGDKIGEANDLNNMGILNYINKNYPLALEFFQQSWAIYEQIGAVHKTERVEKRIEKTLAKMAGKSDSIINRIRKWF